MQLKWKSWKDYNFYIVQFDSNHLLQGFKIVSSVFPHPRALRKRSLKGAFETITLPTWEGRLVSAFAAAWQLLMGNSSFTDGGGNGHFDLQLKCYFGLRM